MATEIERIQKLVKNNWDGPMWHGNNLQEVLKNITWQQAFEKPAGFSHNIYEYVRHITCWRHFTVEMLKGNAAYKVEINSETDWVRHYDKTEAAWQAALSELEQNQTTLSNALATFTDSQLDELVPERKFKWYVLLHGVIHHDIYHSGQIAVLKKQTADQ